MYHPTVETIKKLLDSESILYEVFEHAPVRTSEEASNIRHGYTIHQGAKAIIVRVKIPNKGKKFIMLVVPGDMRFSEKQLKANLGITEVRFATEVEVGEITNGILPGGVPPFGNLFGLEVYVDPEVLKNEKIIFNAGDRSYSIAMRAVDYEKIVTPTIVQII
jgi:prolyl-tRNA editing enzyme YbaK/EbsC (Cys-tRNA(Pro) deacylase)